MTPVQRLGFSPTLDTPLYQQMYEHLRASVLRGELKAGTRLPSTRALATELGVSRNTILNAYRQLAVEGYLVSAAGSGTYVAAMLPDHLLAAPDQADDTTSGSMQPCPPRFADRAMRQLAAPQMPPATPAGGSPRRPFRFGVPALEAFPFKLWSRLVVHQARRMPADAFTYQDRAGYRPLREAIAAHVTLSRRVHCTPDQIIVVSGAQGGLDLAARLLLNPGEAVWMEDPGYLKARSAFLGSGAEIVPIPVDQEGLVVDAGLARAPRARLAYTTPSHQFPLGVTLSLARRLALLDWAERANAYVLEDDYDSDYRFAGRPLPALQGLNARGAGRVIYIGTFSKVLFPALRLGYLVLPPPLVEAFRTVRALIDTHPPLLEQAVLTDFIVEGHLNRHLRRMRSLYAERRAALLEAVAELPLDMRAAEAGLHCIGWLPQGMDDRALAAQAAAHAVDLAPISDFSLEPLSRKGFVFGYGEFNVAQIQDGMRRLAAAMRSL